MKRTAIITFDYEVFLGRKTGTVENCVLKPTKELLEILKANRASAIFFVDATWLLFLKEHFHSDFITIAKQLEDIIALGSSVELHLHPQWIDAYHAAGEIAFASHQHYKLHSLNREDILKIFKDSIDVLEQITNRKVCCFRAGGWCIAPFARIRDAFEAFNIRYDFSVVPGASLNAGEVYDYDFEDAPRLPFYRFRADVDEEDECGDFLEVPISTYYNNIFYRIANKVILRMKGDMIFGDGIGMKSKSIRSTVYHSVVGSRGMLTLDKTSHLFLRYLLMTHFRKFSLLVVVSHPKTTSPEALRNLTYITKKYDTLNSSELGAFFVN